ncbi:21864_t:CDS:2 [Gigaspora margarita]|uniref:21864_t:CDS:1 n=1 Tax=Gigaspora margarita TaxID=4874 RepID=A0ABN7V4Y0_GIGMA|nr:21864_t:CDS:2 [Gigaspora margarita]
MTEISAGAPLPKNSHRKKGAENISQMISDGIRDDTYPQNSIPDISNDLLLQRNQISSSVPMLTLAQLFDKATVAEYSAICANQEEILCWCYYGKEFIIHNGKIGEKKAKGIVYDKMLEQLSINPNIEFTDVQDKSIDYSSDDLPETKVSIPTKSQHEHTSLCQTSNSSSSKAKVSISTESQISDSSDSARASMTVPKKLPELLIKNESNIDALIILLRQKFKMSEERLEQWRANIAFELRDNKNYWKKERESMSEANFLEHKQNFEAKMGVPTTPHKKELKNRSLALIEYA